MFGQSIKQSRAEHNKAFAHGAAVSGGHGGVYPFGVANLYSNIQCSPPPGETQRYILEPLLRRKLNECY
jgi:hypothetical protein